MAGLAGYHPCRDYAVSIIDKPHQWVSKLRPELDGESIADQLAAACMMGVAETGRFWMWAKAMGYTMPEERRVCDG